MLLIPVNYHPGINISLSKINVFCADSFINFFLLSVTCHPYLVDLSSWTRRLSEQEKGEEEGILYDDYGSSDESEGIS